ncbi:hypothetical protein Pmani_004864 [Petrolisthes manimaculis]|uniref:Uncharacterized protein n=1 Tax=Petrolisthes manimaculis TaxID=1843537 RepID=A0AAE1QCW7_9EUCA|nr:hypothetical protein Pmani_004864 [Petrolisthes manimaculis]
MVTPLTPSLRPPAASELLPALYRTAEGIILAATHPQQQHYGHQGPENSLDPGGHLRNIIITEHTRDNTRPYTGQRRLHRTQEITQDTGDYTGDYTGHRRLHRTQQITQDTADYTGHSKLHRT